MKFLMYLVSLKKRISGTSGKYTINKMGRVAKAKRELGHLPNLT